MVTKDLAKLSGLCHKVLSGSNRSKIYKEWEGEWFKNSLARRGLRGQGGGAAWEGRGAARKFSVKGNLMGWAVGRWLFVLMQIWVRCRSSIRL